MSYGTVYVASVAMGAKDKHTLTAFLEAEAYGGPSIVIIEEQLRQGWLELDYHLNADIEQIRGVAQLHSSSQ